MSIPPPWGAYIAGNPLNNLIQGGTLVDITGNGRDATIIQLGTMSSGSTTGFGTTASIPYIQGTTTTQIVWPVGSIASTFTICSIAKYASTSNRMRILDGSGNNWLHGHWYGNAGCAHYGDWKNNAWTSPDPPTSGNNLNWVITCGTNGSSNAVPGNILVNSVEVGVYNGGAGNVQLTINAAYGEPSDFQFNSVYIWNVALTNAQMKTVSDLLVNYVYTGSIVYPWKTGTLNNLVGYYNFSNVNASKHIYNIVTQQYDLVYTPGSSNSISVQNTTVNSFYSPSSLYSSSFSSSSYYSISSLTTDKVYPNFSVAFWFKSTNGNYAGYNTIFDVVSGNNRNNGGVYICADNRWGTMAVDIVGNANASNYNGWTHYAMTVSHNASNNTTTLAYYLNGTNTTITQTGSSVYTRPTSTANGTAIMPYISYNSSYSPVIYVFSSFPISGSTVIGYMDELMLFNRILNQTDVANLYNFNYSSGYITIGSVPSITSLTYDSSNFYVSFTPSTGGNPSPTYYYSLNGGQTYINANITTSPLTISNVTAGVTYQVALIANNTAGNTAPSNTVIGFIPYPCFLQGTKILRMNQETDDEEYVPVETLRRGDIIKTVNHGYKAIELIGKREIESPLSITKDSSRLYWFRKSKISGLREDLCVTGDHCILHKSITDAKKDQVFGYMGDIYITEGHYRVPAFLDDRSEPYEDSSPATIWHFALENNNIYHNYGVYANGLLVESSSLHYMYKYSNMQLID